MRFSRNQTVTAREAVQKANLFVGAGPPGPCLYTAARSLNNRVTPVLPAKLNTTLRRLHKSRTFLPALQILSGVLTGFASHFGWSFWWLCAVPWMVLNFTGILLAIPVVSFALLTAGISGFEWRTHAFFLGWFIGAPTLLSILFGIIWNKWRNKRAAYVRPGTVPVRR